VALQFEFSRRDGEGNNVQLAEGTSRHKFKLLGLRYSVSRKFRPQVRGPVSGNFNLSGPLTELSMATIQGTGTGRLNVGGGTLRATNIQLAEGRFTAQVQASGVPVERLANVPPQIRGPLSGTFNLAGDVANLSPATIQASGSGSLNIGGGTLRATNVQLANGNFTAQVQASGVPVERLGKVPPQVRGPLSGTFNLAGNVANLSPASPSRQWFGEFECRWRHRQGKQHPTRQWEILPPKSKPLGYRSNVWRRYPPSFVVLSRETLI
jgi:translocation and assembly module TamB